MNKVSFFSFLITVFLHQSLSAQLQKGNMLVGKTDNEQFGRSVKISADGSIVAVAAPLNSKEDDKKGRIAVYKYDGAGWKMLGKEILPGTDDFRYGEMMELSADGKKLVVASLFGSVSVYSFNGSDWQKSPKTVRLKSKYDQIEAISITPDANRIAVAYENYTKRGICVSFFRFAESQWLQDGADLMPFPGENTYGLSLCFSADGHQVAIGNPGKNAVSYKEAGEIVVYTKTADQWVQQGQRISGETFRANLGSGVKLSADGKTMIISSSSDDMLQKNAGFAETYMLSDTTWIKSSPAFRPEKPNSFSAHAISLSADGKTLALSTTYIGFAKPGYVKVYKNKHSGWQEIATITDDGGVEKTKLPNNTVGWSIALSSDGKTLAVGFPHNDENGDMAGKVIVYDLSAMQ